MEHQEQSIVNVVAMGRRCSQPSVEVLETIAQICDFLDSPGLAPVDTSMRSPAALRHAAALAVGELGVAPSAIALSSTALRTTLEGLVMQAILDDHCERYPASKPDLGDLAISAAEIDGHPLAREPDRLRRAAAEIVSKRPEAGPEDVLLWAEARAFAA
ncbi:MAG TPA: hypothetical protein VFI65_06620 [Streptosporangiaceae bacterium]|nr:hypothetical protein [Streptosporangiaceae bacterium]